MSLFVHFPLPQLPLLVEGRAVLSLWYKEDIFHMAISSPTFKKQKEDQSVLVPAVFQVPLTRNAQYATVAHFEVACFELLQLLLPIQTPFRFHLLSQQCR